MSYTKKARKNYLDKLFSFSLQLFSEAYPVIPHFDYNLR